tara:strand:+ start:6469 stop:7617 length:1149 start_codon:yes stop_codon:yes gene_type:complete
MGISSFAAGFLESAAERIDTREKEAREVNRLKAEKQLKDFAEATKIKKAKRLEFKNNVQQIERALTSTKKSLSSTAIISIATDKTRMTQFLNLAKSNPQELDQYIKADEDPNLTLAQQVELAAERATPDVAPMMEQSARYFGLPLGDTGAPIEAGAAAAGVTEEQFKAGLAPTVPTAPEFKEDLAVAQRTTFNKTQDQAQLRVVSLRNQLKDAKESNKPDIQSELEEAEKGLAFINSVKKGGTGGEQSVSNYNSLYKAAFKSIAEGMDTNVTKGIIKSTNKYGEPYIQFASQATSENRKALIKSNLEKLDAVISNSSFLKDPSKDWYDKKTLEINEENFYPLAYSSLIANGGDLVRYLPNASFSPVKSENVSGRFTPGSQVN